jgi:hypothetical protein
MIFAPQTSRHTFPQVNSAVRQAFGLSAQANSGCRNVVRRTQE